jgi:hypothetical protein
MRTAVGLAAAAIIFAASAVAAPMRVAHDGGIWYTTAAKVAHAIPDKFPAIGGAACYPLRPELRRRYHAHSFVSRETRYWDHFACVVVPKSLDYGCGVVAHVVGQTWDAFYLTRYPKAGFGCGPDTFQ